MKTGFAVSQYLVDRFQEIGINHLFRAPGDYVIDY